MLLQAAESKSQNVVKNLIKIPKRSLQASKTVKDEDLSNTCTPINWAIITDFSFNFPHLSVCLFMGCIQELKNISDPPPLSTF